MGAFSFMHLLLACVLFVVLGTWWAAIPLTLLSAVWLGLFTNVYEDWFV